jgi:hypothetical protein
MRTDHAIGLKDLILVANDDDDDGGGGGGDCVQNTVGSPVTNTPVSSTGSLISILCCEERKQIACSPATRSRIRSDVADTFLAAVLKVDDSARFGSEA